MKPQIVFIHGRAQEHKDAAELKAKWISAWVRGLELGGLQQPVAESEIRFPYYGQTMFDLTQGKAGGEAAEVVIKGSEIDDLEEGFFREVLAEVQQSTGITDQQLAQASYEVAKEKGLFDAGWVRSILRAVDKHVPGGSGAGIALATHDVYIYLKNPGIRDVIESGVRKAITPGVPTVVVAHSLGSVVGYNLLRREGAALGWNVPVFITVGSPLAVTAIKRALAPIAHPSVVGAWKNARDPRDIVALYPLDGNRFGVVPSVESFQGVRNETPNRHGIDGYLSDPVVAKWIYDAVVG